MAASTPSKANERLRSHAMATAWAQGAGKAEIADMARRGALDESAHSSCEVGFTWGAALLQSIEGMRWALEAGWRADRPCFFTAGSLGRSEAWKPYEALAYGLGPAAMPLVEAAERLRILSAFSVPMDLCNPLAETALHHAARHPWTAPSGRESASPIMSAILSMPGRVHALASGGRAALHVARGSMNIVELLRAGADPDARDARGAKAIDALMALPEGPRAWVLFERGLLEASAPEARGAGSGIRRL